MVGLTGGIGSGKSTAAAVLADCGAVVIDVDAIGRAVIAPGGRAETAVAREFGPGVLDEAGHIDRAALAAVVFQDTERLESLEAISHPAINEELEEVLSGLAADSIVVLDMAVLAESNLGKLASGRGYQLVIVVEAPEALRMERLVDRGHTSTEARSRMAAQASDSDRRALADHVVVNDGGLDDLTAKMQVVWKQLMRSLRAGDA